jgi:DNA polymerase-3 subunit gamma/tau
LHQQSEAGKDMMRLMSDLIAYLRDLLVFKAKPDALTEDVEPGIQTSLASHADLITTERLLELIDQFAVAEGRMKWAPNKKLHFEVAIIRAIQTLGQATLDEVIEKLGELRDGGGTRSASPTRKTAVAGAHRSGEQSSASKAALGETNHKTSAPHVAETPPDANELWQQTLGKIPAQKAFVRNSAVAAYVLGIEGRNFQLGFASADKALMEILGTPANRRFLETLLHEITGIDLTVKLVIKEELPSKQTSGAEGSRPENFKEDPLIQEAIGLFNAQIVQES